MSVESTDSGGGVLSGKVALSRFLGRGIGIGGETLACSAPCSTVSSPTILLEFSVEEGHDEPAAGVKFSGKDPLKRFLILGFATGKPDGLVSEASSPPTSLSLLSAFRRLLLGHTVGTVR